MENVEVIRLSNEELILSSAPDYVPQPELDSVLDRLAFRGNVVLQGPKGTGKSLALAAYAQKRGVPFVMIDCSEDTRRSQLLGGFVVYGDRTPFVLGPLPLAIEAANETGEAILCLEEFNTLSPQMQKVFNGLLDFRNGVTVPEVGRKYQLQPGKKLWVVATMNFSSYGGVFELNEDLKSRLRFVKVGYPDAGSESAILEHHAARLLGGKVSTVTKKYLKQVVTLARESRALFEYKLSTRDLVQMTEDSIVVSPAFAIQIARGKFETSADEESPDLKSFNERTKSIFGELSTDPLGATAPKTEAPFVSGDSSKEVEY